MAEDTDTTTTTNTTQQVAMSLVQPNSRLHALPQELQEMIFSFVVISPNPIPARVHLRDIETFSDDDDDDDDSTNSHPSDSDNSPTTFATRVKITPSQPALSRTDRRTRPTVLRIFYTQNTFLFRAHAYAESPLRNWLDATECNYAPEARLVRRVMLEMREVAEVAERRRREAERQRRDAERQVARLARERELAEWRARLDAAAAERAARIDAERTERAARRAEAAEDAAKALAYLRALNEDMQEKRQPRSRAGCLVM